MRTPDSSVTGSISFLRRAVISSLTVLLLGGLGSASAGRGVMVFGSGEKIIRVADLPNRPNLQATDGSYIDAGYRYSYSSVFFVPIWAYEGRWTGYAGGPDSYVDLSKAQLDAYAAAAGLELPDSPPLPFWDFYGSKMLLALLAFLGIRALVTA